MYHVKGKYVTPPEQGRLSECIDLVSRNMLFPEDRTRFLEFFNLDALRQKLCGGPGIPYRRIPQALARPGSTTGRRSPCSPWPSPTAATDLSRLHHGYRDKKQAEEVAQQNILLERQRLDDERYRTSWSRRTPSSSSGTSKPDTRYISPEIVARFAGNYDHRDLMRLAGRPRDPS